jgi:hypothetical protein
LFTDTLFIGQAKGKFGGEKEELSDRLRKRLKKDRYLLLEFLQ